MLAGGKGTRMGNETPKILTKIDNNTILDYQLRYFRSYTWINKIILSLGHRADEIISYVNKNYPDFNITFSIEKEPLGTGGGTKKALEYSDGKTILLVNGDNIIFMDLNKLRDIKYNAILVSKRRSPFARVIEDDGYAKFEEKPLLPHWTSCGWYVFRKDSVLKYLPDKGSIEYDTIPKMRIRLFKHKWPVYSLNSKKDIDEFRKENSIL